MRLARHLALTVVLGLALAPSAFAHGGEEPTHRDTPADLKGADITRTLALARLARTSPPNLTRWLPTGAWCGTRTTSDVTAYAAFPTTLRQIKLVYAYATDEPDRSAEWSDALQADVSNIQQYLALQTGGRRALRFDMGTHCGPQYVDIQVVPLPNTRTYYRDDPSGFDRLVSDVLPRLSATPSPRDVFILADQLTDDPVWGIAEVVNDDSAGSGNRSNTGGMAAIMWTNPSTAPDPSDWWQPTVMLHEITHNLGGVQQSAPNHTDNWHCTDGEDVMCYDDGSSQPYDPNVCARGSGAIPQTYDCGHNDYFNPDPAPGTYLATHWNVYRSAFLAPCASLGAACGDNVVPSYPVNTALPSIAGTPERGAALTATAGTWLNSPTTFALRWQRAAGTGWAEIPGAVTATYMPTDDDAGAALRVVVTAANDDGSAIVASAPTAPVTGLAAPPAPAPPKQPAALTTHTKVRIPLRDRKRHTTGTLGATITSVPAGREVRVAATRVALPAGTWRLRLCAGPRSGRLRCAVGARVKSRRRGVRLPPARVVVRGSKGALRITAAAVDGRLRVRAQGEAATS
ncbi:MAG TPA: hypothetical protein VKB54_14875 [Solirubrobacteraceae bacterium]|nr:hypothetical protein [Solirubrobacteraceae bacterium]